MTKRCELIVGQVFGRLTVLAEAEPKAGLRRLLCRCACGVEVPALRKTLVSGLTKSCGCLRSEVSKALAPTRVTHGVTGTRDYNCWASMIHRCNSKGPADKGTLRYRDRGITVDPRWLKFENFLADMGPRPLNMSLERLNNNSLYTLSNCIWADARTQANNRSSNLFVVFQGMRMTATQAAETVGLHPGTVYSRKRKGWPEEDWFKPAGYRPNNSIAVTLDGELTTLTKACQKLNLKTVTVHSRISSGWPEEDWFKPAGYKRNKPTKETK